MKDCSIGEMRISWWQFCPSGGHHITADLRRSGFLIDRSDSREGGAGGSKLEQRESRYHHHE